jgi:rhodanese-related sulfurtransferase/DNA-binding transcriptional ArsR family regulator
MGKRAVKDAVYGQLERLGRAISSGKRLEILDLLSQGEKSVEQLADALELSVGNASAHLKVLRTAQLVASRKQGQFVYYRLADASVAHFWLVFRQLAEERYAELRELMREHFSDPQGSAPVEKNELLSRLRKGEITVIDVRPADEFAAGHLPGAISIPIRDLAKRIASLPRQKEVIAYCRGPYCVYALDAVELLRKRGLKARRFDGSVAALAHEGVRLQTED